jgi:hypothetical protein
LQRRRHHNEVFCCCCCWRRCSDQQELTKGKCGSKLSLILCLQRLFMASFQAYKYAPFEPSCCKVPWSLCVNAKSSSASAFIMYVTDELQLRMVAAVAFSLCGFWHSFVCSLSQRANGIHSGVSILRHSATIESECADCQCCCC